MLLITLSQGLGSNFDDDFWAGMIGLSRTGSGEAQPERKGPGGSPSLPHLQQAGRGCGQGGQFQPWLCGLGQVTTRLGASVSHGGDEMRQCLRTS